jgi:hypothetical protein
MKNIIGKKSKRLMTKMGDKSQSSKVKAQNYSSKVKTELFSEMNKFLVLSCSFYF